MGGICLAREWWKAPPPAESWMVLITFWSHICFFLWFNQTHALPWIDLIMVQVFAHFPLDFHKPDVRQTLQRRAAQWWFLEFSKVKPRRRGLLETVCFEQLEFNMHLDSRWKHMKAIYYLFFSKLHWPSSQFVPTVRFQENTNLVLFSYSWLRNSSCIPIS